MTTHSNPPPIPELREFQAPNYANLYIALYRSLLKLRGADPATVDQGARQPATTNDDVKQLAALWTKAVLKAGTKHHKDRTAHDRWQGCVSDVEQAVASKHTPSATYPYNEAFWRCMRRAAIWLDSRKQRPSKWDMWWESVDEAAVGLPHTLSSVATAVGSTGRAAADTAGDAAMSVGRGISEFFSEPVRLVAVLIGGAILIPPVIRAIRD